VLAGWWQEFSQASDAMREDLVAQLREEQHKGQRRVRAPRPAERPAAEIAAAPVDSEEHEYGPERADDGPRPESGESSSSDAPRKRRRRRRKPAGDGSALSGAAPAGPQD
jgi:poly(A) polymerase